MINLLIISARDILKVCEEVSELTREFADEIAGLEHQVVELPGIPMC